MNHHSPLQVPAGKELQVPAGKELQVYAQNKN